MYKGRLAPSPTGLLHLGHARTFWIACERARAAGGTLLLRDEDLDFQRAKPEYSHAMKEDLRWLGITWEDEQRQSDRLELYRDAMMQLVRSGHAYPCTCSRKDLAQAMAAPHEDSTTAPNDLQPDPDDEPVYNGRCRPHVASPWNGSCHPERSEGPALPAQRPAFNPATNYRLRVPDGEAINFLDGHAGPQSFVAGCTREADFGDFLVWRRKLTNDPRDHGLPSYQLACVVDDAAMRITEVVRGRDLLKSTARQILLQRALGLPTPAYFHTDLMRDDLGVRLAKRHDALALRTLREQGHTPAQVRAMFESSTSQTQDPASDSVGLT
ncbi:glutamyl-tRNA synthetase [Bryocella elongata]|uniref:Glutamyl-tRNA synthetase n=1 Tax=Bryocella elongata TaxID=863522 RepID=A0A1H6BIQ2_9BACT|nr:tRNA glutamyl-Q(34) synthetase GluQRS [Bryocella elongata]SEG60086.1 glutamyl-tRNA synthetase [Bryocella elongata]